MIVIKSRCLIILALIFIVGCESDNTPTTTAPASETAFSIGTNTQCSASHSLVGTSVEMTSHSHNVQGTFTIIDDCTIEFTQFSYDGGGPAVYFYTGNNGDYAANDAVRISSLLTGTAFSNDTVRLVLPNSVTLDGFNGVSVWCVDFAANFGDARF